MARLEEACASALTMAGGNGGGSGCIGEDPALDQFMEAYCEMLTKYEQELSKPFREAMHFLHTIESQFKSLTISSPSSDFGDYFSLFIILSNILCFFISKLTNLIWSFQFFFAEFLT